MELHPELEQELTEEQEEICSYFFILSIQLFTSYQKMLTEPLMLLLRRREEEYENLNRNSLWAFL